MSIIKHVTLQKIVAHDFRYGPRILVICVSVNPFTLNLPEHVHTASNGKDGEGSGRNQFQKGVNNLLQRDKAVLTFSMGREAEPWLA